MTSRLLIVPVLAVALTVTGCGVKADPVALPPGSEQSSPASGSDAFAGKYTKLNGACPKLDGDTAEERTAGQFEKDWQTAVGDGRTLAAKPASGVGDQAYLGVDRDRQSIVLATRASNAQILLSYGVADMEPESFAANRDSNAGTMVALGRDVLDDLS